MFLVNFNKIIINVSIYNDNYKFYYLILIDKMQ